jgi:hypothetical protein
MVALRLKFLRLRGTGYGRFVPIRNLFSGLFLSYLSEILKYRLFLLEIPGLGADWRTEMLLRAALCSAALKFRNEKSSFICD